VSDSEKTTLKNKYCTFPSNETIQLLSAPSIPSPTLPTSALVQLLKAETVSRSGISEQLVAAAVEAKIHEPEEKEEKEEKRPVTAKPKKTRKQTKRHLAYQNKELNRENQQLRQQQSHATQQSQEVTRMLARVNQQHLELTEQLTRANQQNQALAQQLVHTNQRQGAATQQLANLAQNPLQQSSWWGFLLAATVLILGLASLATGICALVGITLLSNALGSLGAGFMIGGGGTAILGSSIYLKSAVNYNQERQEAHNTNLAATGRLLQQPNPLPQKQQPACTDQRP